MKLVSVKRKTKSEKRFTEKMGMFTAKVDICKEAVFKHSFLRRYINIVKPITVK